MTNPEEKLEIQKKGEEGVYKYYYSNKVDLCISLQKLVSIFSHSNSGESTVYFPINGTVVIFDLSNFFKILPYIRTLFSWLNQPSYIFTCRLVFHVILSQGKWLKGNYKSNRHRPGY